jgi:hypothetical protein
MKKLWDKIRGIDRNTLIKNSFLLPIVSVVIISISHVINWYDIGNPISWAIYLSVAVEVFALASVSAASLKMKKGSIWLLFGLVTAIQIMGNVFFTYKDIDPTGAGFIAWMELIQPWFEDWNIMDHKRFLAYIQGGTLPFMSLIALHFYIKFNDNLSNKEKIEPQLSVPEGKEFNTAYPITDEIMEEISQMPMTNIVEEDNIEEMIPDIAVKEALKEKQIKEETKEATNDIVQKVTPVKTIEPDTNPGQTRGHRKKPGNDQNPQIMPGVN